MKTIIKVAFIAFLSLNVKAQAPLIEWDKSLGGTDYDFSYSIIEISSGGYMAVGWSTSSDVDVSNNYGLEDVWVIRLDVNGGLLWEKNYGGSSSDHGVKVLETTDGNFLILSYSYSNNIDLSTNAGDYDAWLFKIDGVGNIVWDYSFAGSNFDTPIDAINTSDGGLLISGSTLSSDGDFLDSQGGEDAWMAKFTASGSLSWLKMFGGSWTETGNALVEISDGYILAGKAESIDGDVSVAYGQSDAWLIKTDFNGNMIWEKSYGSSGEELFTDIIFYQNSLYALSPADNLSGDISNFIGTKDAWLLNIDLNGNIIWDNSYGGTGSDYGQRLLVLNNGNIGILGGTNSNDFDVSNNYTQAGWVFEVSPTGGLNWSKTFGGSGWESPVDIVNTIDGGFITCLSSNSTDGEITAPIGGRDYWIVKFSAVQGIDELSTDKKLIQVVDLLGRETTDEPNTVLIQVYSDGTTKRVYRFE